MHQLLKRLRITWQRARCYIHSPDLDYDAKLANVQAVRMLARLAPGQVVLVYLDEVTIEQQPSLAQAYAVQDRGLSQPRARWSHSSNILTRVVATLEHGTGRVVARRASKITIATLVQFFQDLRAAYPHAERIYVVMDNWPVHIHPDVLIALEAQETRHLRPLPPSWPTTPSAAAVKRWGQLKLPIQLVPLPTYASWCNPIEKPGTLWVPQTAPGTDASAPVRRRSATAARGDRPILGPIRERFDRSLTLCGLGNTRLIS